MFEISDFLLKTHSNKKEPGNFQWSAPSNIALVKYWGKKNNQIPANPSISFTLKNCKTITQLSFEKRANLNQFSFELLFEGEKKETFKPKVQSFLEKTEPFLPFLKNYHFKIETQNTFPHSSGIASSASGMAALAMNFMSLEKILVPKMEDDFFYKKASFLARLGSGSASRSCKGNLVVWGKHNQIEESSDYFGVPFLKTIHPIFHDFQDTILLVDKSEKEVSSSVGHNLMHNHPYAEKRFEQAHTNISKLIPVFESGDLESFINIVESEALTLHAMMLTSMPYYILIKPNTLHIINEIWKFRKETKHPICFTLDAGANVHILYPKYIKEKILSFINEKLVGYCQNAHYICDEIGFGAIQEK